MPTVTAFGGLGAFGFGVFPGGALESIATITVGSGGASSLTFSDIPSGFQHLQIRGIVRWATGTDAYAMIPSFNSNTTASNYNRHYIYAEGASAIAGYNGSVRYLGSGVNANATASIFAAQVIDILDYASTSKNKTVRSIHGYDANGSGFVQLDSHLWQTTSAITSLSVSGPVNFAQYTALALYGMRA